MAQNQPPPKPKWNVGSFFQQAVAGVESKLDLILAEEEDRKHMEQQQGKDAPAKPNQSGSHSRSSSNASNARKNDRLQERLARAVVKNNAAPNATTSASRVSSPVSSPRPSTDARPSTDVESRVESPAGQLEEVLTGQDQPEDDNAVAVDSRASHDSSRKSKDIGAGNADDPAPGAEAENVDRPASVNSTRPQLDDTESRPSNDSAQPAVDLTPQDITPAPGDQDKTIAQVQAEYKAAESNWQQEMYGYIERIDALQSKLKYLAKEAAESAKQAAASAEPGSVEKQLREKDEKIALLLEEGQKLSKTELDHRTAIKKLRQQLTDNSKTQVETKKKMDRLERDLGSANARAKRAEAAEKRANELLSTQAKASRDFEAVTNERNALTETVQEMRDQLARAVARAEAAESKAQSDALEQEKGRTSQLEEELASVQTEREVNEENMQREISDLKEAVLHEKERARALEAELKNEQTVLESKMESLRARAEEASSGIAGDAQAKLLRQIETLQTQYAVASENWQALEGSLLARLANVEKERDELTRREGEMRRKIREVNLKSKKIEEELESAKETENDLESKLEERVQELLKLEQRLQKANDEFTSAQKDFIEQKKISDATWTQRFEDEQAKWRELAMPSPGFLQPRNESPSAISRRPRDMEAAGSLSDMRPLSRRSSTLPFGSPEVGTPPRQNSFPAAAQSPPVGPTPQLADNLEQDEFFTRSGTPSAFGGAPTQNSRGINDLISESTVGTGPSVQLVERMSATVRRLESEKAASKDELARITSQRDEARQQVVDLMRESEEKKASDARIEELETHITSLDERYQTTLEMLGEKSEQVEELQADIADLKKIYRELVDSTMK